MNAYPCLKLLLRLILIAGISCSCESTPEKIPEEQNEDKLFQTISGSSSGILFQNKIVETESSNYYKYMYNYIGGGVAAADFNNDGFEDLFFISNSFENKLYLNQGDFKFKDYTEAAGIVKREGFDAGVTVVDINNDGFLDIYISRGGWIEEGNRFANMLYVNNGPDNVGENGISFTERAAEYGLAENNRTIASTFFDYDRDGDLDVYISNSPDFQDRAAEVIALSDIPGDPNTLKLKGSDKLYQNDGKGHFQDVSARAGILPDIGFGLNPQVGDLNQDGWLDIYVCNDFRIPDFVYINQQDGTFREERNETLKHLSFNSMGSDIADVNNDGLMDIFTLDMNPEDYVRSKTTMGMTSLDRFQTMVDRGYHYNYMHNMLQINNGNGSFREIAQMAGVGNTDWSWACLLADFDLDGFNDMYVTNGVFRDVIDRDANTAILQKLRENGRKPTDADFLAFTQMLPQQKMTNYFFKNKGNLHFENVSSTWTDSIPTFSNGAVYTDLDNDGDLDIVVNNINSEASVLKNTASDKTLGKFLQIKLKGPADNMRGIGALAKITLTNGSTQVRQMINARGFLSAVSGTLHFGLKNSDSLSSLEVIWPDDKSQIVPKPATNQVLTLDYKDADEVYEREETNNKTFLFSEINSNFEHKDPAYNDYSQQILLPHKLSQTGPAACKGDVNGDGLEDVYIGGGHTQAGQLLLATSSGKFLAKSIPDFTRDRQKEDVGAVFFDADQDQDLDLYVVSGSYEFAPSSKLQADRLYLNDGKGNFSKTRGVIPEIPIAGSVVAPADFDKDGDVDLFVGARVIPGAYPYAPESLLLLNEGGKFSSAAQTIAPELAQIGMINDAIWEDMDGDDDLDLILTGEWMGIEVFINEGGKLVKNEAYASLSETKGWWNKLLIADIDQDGDKDILAGNLGLNYKFHASPAKPFHIYTHDFDFNGSKDVILAKYYKDTEVPVRGKTCAIQQIPHLAQKIPTFNDFASRDLEGILGPSLKSALHYEATEFRSGIFLNKGNGNFEFSPFAYEAQQSPINSMLYQDFDKDGKEDLLLAGNNYMSEIETTRADAGIGVLLKGKGKGEFQSISHRSSGFFADKDVRAMLLLNAAQKPIVFVVNNNDKHTLFSLLNNPKPL